VSVSRVSASALTRRGTATITIKVGLRASDRGSVANAVVTVKVVAPNGKATTLTRTTDRRGQVALTLKATGGKGRYVVKVVGVADKRHDYDPSDNRVSSKTVRVR